MDDSENETDEFLADDAFAQDTSAATARPDPHEGAVPPGYDWPTHGGYLGCLLGLIASCLIGGFAAKLVGLFTYYHRITGLTNIILLVAIFALATIVCTNLGWRLGKRFFREYAVKPTWGESDESDVTTIASPPESLHESEA